MRIKPIGRGYGVSEASGVTRDGDTLLVVTDADPGAYYRFPILDDSQRLLKMHRHAVTRHELAGDTLGIDFESIDVLGDGRIVALSERLRSLVGHEGLVFQYDDPFSELGERGLEGLAVRRRKDSSSEVAVLWEGGYVEDTELLRQVRDRIRGHALLPVIVRHEIQPDSPA